MFLWQFTLILYNFLLAICCCVKDNIISTKFVCILMYPNQGCHTFLWTFAVLSRLLQWVILKAIWKSQHQRYVIKVIILKVTISTASAMAYVLQKFHFSIFFKKNKNIFIQCTSIFFPLVIWHQYLFDLISHLKSL